MKKLASLLLAAFLLYVVSACASPVAVPDPTQVVTPSPTPEPTPTPTPSLRELVEQKAAIPKEIGYIAACQHIATYSNGTVLRVAGLLRNGYSYAYFEYPPEELTLKIKFDKSEEWEEGTYAFVVGKVEDGMLVDAYVESVGDKAQAEAQKKEKDLIDKYRREDEANAKSCKKLDYEESLRHPSRGALTYCTGKVFQVVSDALAMHDPYGVPYDYPESKYLIEVGRNEYVYVVLTDKTGALDGRLLENDKVTFYGVLDGTYTYTTLIGKDKTVPRLQAFLCEMK